MSRRLEGEAVHPAEEERWLRNFYFVRAAFAALWVGAAVVLPPSAATVVILLLIYPLWDAAANLFDAPRLSGSAAKLARVNALVSLVAAGGVLLALRNDALSVLLIFGLWAAGSGLLQFAVGVVRRRRSIAGQWPMMLSGIQSAAIGALFISRSSGSEGQPRDLALYAAFGAAYFLIAALVTLRGSRGSG